MTKPAKLSTHMETLFKLQRKAGLSTSEFAKLAKVAETTIYNWQCGTEPSIPAYTKALAVFGYKMTIQPVYTRFYMPKKYAKLKPSGQPASASVRPKKL